MAEESSGEKTEPASAKRRRQSREEGQVAKSQDMTTGISLMTALLALGWLGPSLVDSFLQAIRGVFKEAQVRYVDVEELQNIVSSMVFPVFSSVLLLLFIFMVGGLVVNIMQVGWFLSPKALSPKLEKLNPISGLKRIFSLGSLGTMLTGFMKIAAVGGIAYLFIKSLAPSFSEIPSLQIKELLPYASEKITTLSWRIITAMLAIGILDYIFQWWRHEKQIRMSKQELKEEHKQDEGDPQIKVRIRQIQRERAMARMMDDVPKATVVITNPTHVAVALRYDPESTGAPVVLAKGMRMLAQRIKQIAYEHGIPVLEEPPLARALLKYSEIGREIPPDFYKAVARILAVILRRAEPAGAAQRVPTGPIPPTLAPLPNLNQGASQISRGSAR